jgi:hypothetical protein
MSNNVISPPGDYSNSKPGVGAQYPINATGSVWERLEPLLTPAQLRRQHLFGIPLVSGMKDPITGRADRLTDDDLVMYIDTAVGLAETELSMNIMPTQLKEKHAWDRNEYDSFGYMRLHQRPCASIESFTVNLANNDDIYMVPPDWVETANLYKGQLNILPLTIALSSGNPVAIPSSAGGAMLLSVFQGKSQWVASFWQVLYTVGFPDGKVPKPINDLIGTIAAMEVLSQLASTYGKSSGSSLSIDGGSQSVSTPGPEIFTKRMNDLTLKREMLVAKMKNLYGLKFFSDNV